MDRIKIAVIGLGQRGTYLLRDTILHMDDVDVVAVCDEYPDRVEKIQKMVEEKKGTTPLGNTNYREVVKLDEIDAVIVSTAWEAHVEVACAAMEAGKPVGVEVGGVYSIDDCWRLVRTSERTGMPCMMIENCCYGRMELMCMNIAEKGEFGEIVHCEGGYHHDLREEVTAGNENRHYRLRNYTLRNCDNYPTHALGPIAKLLKINHGNRMLSLVSVASKSAGLHDYVVRRRGADDDLAKVNFAQGDVVTTIIRCAGGETIMLALDTSLPRFYSRGYAVHGTRGYFEEMTNSLFLDRDNKDFGKLEEMIAWKEQWNNVETKYAEEFDHPLWKKYLKEGVKLGHGGMDYLVLRAFFESVMAGVDMPIDVYDTASWMCISALTEQSVLNGGAPVEIPDFTSGKWIKEEKRTYLDEYRLDKVVG